MMGFVETVHFLVMQQPVEGVEENLLNNQKVCDLPHHRKGRGCIFNFDQHIQSDQRVNVSQGPSHSHRISEVDPQGGPE